MFNQNNFGIKRMAWPPVLGTFYKIVFSKCPSHLLICNLLLVKAENWESKQHLIRDIKLRKTILSFPQICSFFFMSLITRQLLTFLFFLKEIIFLSDIWHRYGRRLNGICCKRTLKATGFLVVHLHLPWDKRISKYIAPVMTFFRKCC